MICMLSQPAFNLYIFVITRLNMEQRKINIIILNLQVILHWLSIFLDIGNIGLFVLLVKTCYCGQTIVEDGVLGLNLEDPCPGRDRRNRLSRFSVICSFFSSSESSAWSLLKSSPMYFPPYYSYVSTESSIIELVCSYTRCLLSCPIFCSSLSF